MSRESEQLWEAIGQVADGQIEEAQTARRRFPRWAAGLAAVFALAIALTVFFTGRGGNAYALVEASYPKKETGSRLAIPHNDELTPFIRAAVPRLLEGEAGENRACSPLNIYLALSMLAETAGGESRSQLLALLGAEDLETQRSLARNLWEQNYYEGEDGACRLASSLWLAENLDYDKGTLRTLAEDYSASTYRGTMGSEGYDRALQQWLSEQTGGLLREQAEDVQLSPFTAMALATAIYFKGNWSAPYREARTENGSFKSPSGVVECAMMHGGWEGDLLSGAGFTAVNQAFTNGRSMLFILPEEGTSPEDLLKEDGFLEFLTADHRNWEDRERVTLEVTLPKFDLVTQLNLIPVLRDLGVTDVLDTEKADFSPMLKSGSAAVSSAEHAARVRVDEEGCEAAAFTIISAAGAALETPRRVEFTLDRPFLFVLLGRDDQPLFVGIVNDPTA